MIFREHLYWSLIGFSLSVSIFAVALDYRNIGIWSYLILLVTFVASAIFNEIGNVIDEKKKKVERDMKKLGKKEESNISGSSTRIRLVSYLFLAAFCAYCFWIATPSSDHPLFIAAGYVGAFLGAFAPDLDKVPVDGMKYHRNNITHSGIVVNGVALIALLTLPDYYISLNLLFIGIVLGNSIHLFTDNIESEATLSQIFVDGARAKECPGDLRGIREDRERAWIDLHGVVGIFFMLLLYARFQLVPLMTYPLFWNDWDVVAAPLNGVSSTIVIIYVVYVALSFLARYLWRDVKKERKKMATRKKGLSIPKRSSGEGISRGKKTR